MIKALTIDFWNTLFDSANGESRNAQRRAVLLEAIRRAGNECDDVRFDEVYHGIWAFFDEHWLERQRTPTSREMIDEMLRRLEYALEDHDIASVEHVFSHGVLEHPPALLPGAREALASLYDRGLHLAIISDTAFSPGAVLRALMEQQGIAQYFRTFVFSDESGVAKPHPEAFRLALEHSGALPSEACHIGDIERTDIRGAKAAGMHAILFKGDLAPSKYAEDETKADATITHWNQIVEAIDRIDASVAQHATESHGDTLHGDTLHGDTLHGDTLHGDTLHGDTRA